ncbi:MAG: hypothetical protein M3Q32_04320 [Pseudomonadota bacterium]|nr:hypothetical protein [Pseudomonadota bacterium]
MTDYLNDQGFKISKRSVERDLKSLTGAPFYIERDEAKPEGWCWPRDAKPIEIPAMEPAVALTFKLAETFLARLLPPLVLKHLKNYFDSANGILAGLDTKSLGDWPQRVRILPRGQTLLAPKMRDDVVETVYQALLEGKRFSLRLPYARGGTGT